MEGNYNVKRKMPDGKYRTFGNVKKGQYGYGLGMKVTSELRKLVTDTADGQWLNFALFVQESSKDGAPDASAGRPTDLLE